VRADPARRARLLDRAEPGQRTAYVGSSPRLRGVLSLPPNVPRCPGTHRPPGVAGPLFTSVDAAQARPGVRPSTNKNAPCPRYRLAAPTLAGTGDALTHRQALSHASAPWTSPRATFRQPSTILIKITSPPWRPATQQVHDHQRRPSLRSPASRRNPPAASAPRVSSLPRPLPRCRSFLTDNKCLSQRNVGQSAAITRPRRPARLPRRGARRRAHRRHQFVKRLRTPGPARRPSAAKTSTSCLPSGDDDLPSLQAGTPTQIPALADIWQQSRPAARRHPEDLRRPPR